MKFVQIIPVHNYFEGVSTLITFAKNHYSSLFGDDDFRIVLVDNGSAEPVKKQLAELDDGQNFTVVSSELPRNLKDALMVGCKIGKSFHPDVIHVSETDASPDLCVLQKMLKLYMEERANNLGSVSPMYTWLGRFCYPTHRHWHSDPLYKSHETLGPIADVGAAGVPFLYSLWNPDAFALIGNSGLRPLLHLDSDFGAAVHAHGFRHLRLKSVSIEHVGGGRQSRRRATRS